MFMVTLSIMRVDNRDGRGSFSGESQYTAYIVGKSSHTLADSVQAVEDAHRFISTSDPRLESMLVPESYDDGGKHVYMDEVLSYSSDFDTKSDFMDAVRKALREYKESLRRGNK